jgi:PAS domain S-box-containing protein
MTPRLAKFGLQARFIVLALAAALPALAAVVYYTLTEYENAAEEAEVQLLRLAEVVALRHQDIAEEAGSVLSLLAASGEVGPDDPERCRRFVNRLMASGAINTETLSGVSAVDPGGIVYCSSLQLPEPISIGDRAYFQRTLDTRRPIVGAALTGRATGRPTVPVAYPVLGADNDLEAVLIGALNLPDVVRTALPNLPEDAVVMLVTEDGLVLGRHPDPQDWQGSTLVEEPLVRALGGEPRTVMELVGLDGVERIYATQRTEIGDHTVYAVTGFATDSVYAEPRRTLTVGITLVIAAALAAIALGSILGRNLVARSVGVLADAASRIAAGDLSVRVPEPARGDELASLAHGFNAMAMALEEREAALSDSELRYRQLVELVPAAIWAHADGRIVFVNDQAVRMFGASRADDLVGLSLETLIHPDDLPLARERTRRVVHDPEGILPATEMRFRRRDGRTILVEAQAVRFYRAGAPHVLSAGRDITAQRSAEEQLRQAQKMDSVGRLSGGIAHDFNNLLTVIIGNLESALESGADGARDALDNALQAAERGATLTQRLLAFSRRQALMPEEVDLNRLVAGMDDMLRRTLGEDIEVAMRLDPRLWSTMVDRGQLETALLNLVINARDAMPEGGKLTIETGNVQLDDSYASMNADVEPGHYAMLSVADTGCGMAPEVAERATEPFFTTKEVGKGTGLGLSVVYGFVKQSRGHMKIYSEVGVGTSVRIYLPRLEAGDAAGAAEKSPEPATAPGRGETVLVVEDEPSLRAMVVRQLQDLGYRVLHAPDGATAQRILRTEPVIDLLFTDVVMPGGINGRALAEDARRLRPGLPVLFTSGYAETALLHHGRLEPGMHLLTKPFKKQDLARKIRALLDSADAPDAS